MLFVIGTSLLAAATVHHNGTWDVPCPADKPGACFTPDFVSTSLTFDPPLPSNNASTVAAWFSGCNAGGGWTASACPCCRVFVAASSIAVLASSLEGCGLQDLRCA